jgi:outer membrane protein assembly factor BamE
MHDYQFSYPRANLLQMLKNNLHRLMRPLLGICALAMVIGTAACQSSDRNRTGFFEAYKVDVPQGNYVTKDALAQVKAGMSPQQVKFILGAPLLVPVFSADRWDYVFRHQFANGTSELRRVIVRFTDGKVSKIDADELPAPTATEKK